MKEDQEVFTAYGKGIITRIKQGNFRNQDYFVRLDTGRERWFSLEQLKTE